MAFDATIKEYLKEIDESPLLNWEQEKELASRVIEQNDPEARDRLVRSNLRLVVNIAKRFSGKRMTLGDLIEEGNLGLLRAVDSFDPEHGVRFSTYASWWIKQGIKRSLLLNSQPLHVPTYMVESINQWRYMATELEARLGREADVKEMSEAMKIPLKRAKAVKQVIGMVNMGFQNDSDEDGQGLNETLQDDHAALPEEALVSAEELSKAVRLLGEIEPREAEILTLRFGIGENQTLTLKEIGEKLGLTRERVRQIQRSALAKLNELMSN